jgi:2-C-methyl-D-erythritol 2,4-cyclodiphosphate synthase
MGFHVGIGHDTHRLGAPRPLILGGVEILHSFGLIGHSDADCLLHAVTDALLGALGKGDIGELFPDTDPKHKNKDSAEMLAAAIRELPPGGRILNLDCIVFAQEPKLKPYKSAVTSRLAELLGISPSRVNVKAKTGELVGPIGRGEAIAAEAVVLVELPDD